MEFRKLKSNEIDARVATVNKKGLSLLLYKDARVDQRLLDETVGAMNWQRSHQIIDGRLYCTVSIRDSEHGDWVSKQDVGTESYTEAEKGQASDSFKRACFNWGIGRELYTAPFIWIKAEDCEIKDGSSGKPACYDRFGVSSIGYDENGNVNALVIVNRSRNDSVVYTFGKKPEVKAEEKKPEERKARTAPPRMISETQIATIYNNAKLKGVSVPSLLKYYEVKNIKELTAEKADEAIRKLMDFPNKVTNESAS